MSKRKTKTTQRSAATLKWSDVWSEAGNHSSAGVSVNSTSVFGIPAFYKGVNLISNTVARIPLHVYKKVGENSRERHEKHPAYDLLTRQANPLQSAFQFKKSLIANAIWSGNGYAWIERDYDASPLALWILDPSSVAPVISYEGLKPYLFYSVAVAGKRYEIEASDIIHLKGLGTHAGLVGMSIIDVLKESLGLAIATNKYGATYFKNNGHLSLAVFYPRKLTEEQVLAHRAGFEGMHAGIDNAFKTAIFQDGATAQPWPLSNDEAQFIESRQFSIVDVANVLGLPAHKLNSAVNTSYASIEAENLALLSDCYDPLFIELEQECNKLLTEVELKTKRVYVEFMRDALTRADAKTEADNLINQLNNGVISWQELRAIRNLSTELPEGMANWRMTVQATPAQAIEDPISTPDPTPEPQTNPANDPPSEPAQDAPPQEQRSRPIIRATVERLIERLKKDKDVYLPKHREVFAKALPNCERALNSFFDSLQQELDAVLPEQRINVIERLDSIHLEEAVWNDVI